MEDMEKRSLQLYQIKTERVASVGFEAKGSETWYCLKFRLADDKHLKPSIN